MRDPIPLMSLISFLCFSLSSLFFPLFSNHVAPKSSSRVYIVRGKEKDVMKIEDDDVLMRELIILEEEGEGTRRMFSLTLHFSFFLISFILSPAPCFKNVFFGKFNPFGS